jgi:hypothetical protein
MQVYCLNRITTFGRSQKISLATPKEVFPGLMHLLEHMYPPNKGCPCSSRIVEDCTKFVSNIKVIYDVKGIMVSGVGIELVIFVTPQQAAGKSMDANEKRNPRNTLHGSIQMQWMGLMNSLRIQRESLP